MTLFLFLEQLFNGAQFGVTLFLIAAGLTLILGIMDFVFLAHGSQVMIGAYAAAALTALTGNFFVGIFFGDPVKKWKLLPLSQNNLEIKVQRGSV